MTTTTAAPAQNAETCCLFDHHPPTTMNKYRQTAADLDGYEQQDPEAIAGMVLAAILGIAIACALVAWWSS